MESISKGKRKESMTHKIKRCLSRFADALEAFVRFIVSAIELVVIDATYGHGRNRKRSPYAVIQRTYNRTYVQPVIREPLLPSERATPRKYRDLR